MGKQGAAILLVSTALLLIGCATPRSEVPIVSEPPLSSDGDEQLRAPGEQSAADFLPALSDAQQRQEKERVEALQAEDRVRFATYERIPLSEAGSQQWVSPPQPADIDAEPFKNLVFEYRIVGGRAVVRDVDALPEMTDKGVILVVTFHVVVADNESVLEIVRAAGS